MIKKILNVFLAFLFVYIFTIETANSTPIYTPSPKSVEYILIGWVIEPTWMGDYWSIHAYNPDSPSVEWDDYEE